MALASRSRGALLSPARNANPVLWDLWKQLENLPHTAAQPGYTEVGSSALWGLPCPLAWSRTIRGGQRDRLAWRAIQVAGGGRALFRRDLHHVPADSGTDTITNPQCAHLLTLVQPGAHLYFLQRGGVSGGRSGVAARGWKARGRVRAAKHWLGARLQGKRTQPVSPQLSVLVCPDAGGELGKSLSPPPQTTGFLANSRLPVILILWFTFSASRIPDDKVESRP